MGYYDCIFHHYLQSYQKTVPTYRHYNGLMDYYADRWELFFDTIEDNGGKCNHNIVDKYKNLVETQVEQKYIQKPLAVRTEIKEYWNVLRPIYDKYAVHGSLYDSANDVL